MPGPQNDPGQFLASIFDAGQKMMAEFVKKGSAAEPVDASTDAALPLWPTLQSVAALHKNELEKMTALWKGMLDAQMSFSPLYSTNMDARFADIAWKNDPRYSFLLQGYLAYSDFLKKSVESAPVDDKNKEQLRFTIRQVIDAMSPTNFLATNPEAIKLALETGGKSLTDGVGLFLQDMAKGRISMTDERQFEVGKNLAVSQGEVIYENTLIQLIQYAPLSSEVQKRPLIIIPPCINKFYILDLQPENSLVKYALEQGNTVFLVSWRNITPELGYLTWDDYLQTGVLQAIDVALDVTGADQVNTLGFCVGGTLLASAVALMKGRNEDKVASLTLLTAMLDFSDTGEIGVLVTDASVGSREAEIGNGGVMSGKDLALTFSSLRANDLIWPYVVNNYLKGKEPAAFDLLYWNSDATNLPGPMFTWYIRNTYLENKLRSAGKTIQCGVPVDLTRIDVPAYLFASREDHIVPWRTAYASSQLLTGDKTFVLGASGHIAGVINPPSKNKRNYWMGEASGQAPDKWLDGAESVPGSWWPHWANWLKLHAGGVVKARNKLGNKRYPPIESAPGRYVKQRVT